MAGKTILPPLKARAKSIAVFNETENHKSLTAATNACIPTPFRIISCKICNTT